MKIIELTLNEKAEAGVDAVALVEEPAIEQDFYAFNAQKYYFETYNDYPQKVRDNAKIGIERNARIGNECATQVGKVRAQQLVNGENLSLDTIRRMRSFLIRQKNNFELARSRQDYNACGYISYMLWGGPEALPWAEKKLRQAGNIFNEEFLILDSFAESKQTFSKVSLDFDGVLTTADGRILLQELIAKGYEVYVISARDNKPAILELVKPYGVNPANVYAVSSNLEKVNTIKQLGIEKHYDNNPKVVAELGQIGQQFAEIGPRGGVKESPKAPKSDTPNPTPKGEDTAKGDASTSRGAEVDKATEETLQQKVDEFNEKYKDKLGYGVTIGQLKSVYQRGVGAYNTSHSPNVSSAKQWALARVNAFLYLVKEGRPQNRNYTTDYDLLPTKHPKREQLSAIAQHLIFHSLLESHMEVEVSGLPTYINEPVKQRKLVGPLMIPNKLIRRVDEDTNEEYFVYFTEDTIRKLAEKFMKDGNIHSSNVEHNGASVDGVSLIETWVIEDMDMDKSNLYGQQHPVGTWMGMYKIDNPKIWEKVENKEIKGFSVEGWFNELLRTFNI